MREMLAEPSWTASPSGALLESFDFIVFNGPHFYPHPFRSGRPTAPPRSSARAVVTLDRLRRSLSARGDELPERAPPAPSPTAPCSPRRLLREGGPKPTGAAGPRSRAYLDTARTSAMPEKTKLLERARHPRLLRHRRPRHRPPRARRRHRPPASLRRRPPELDRRESLPYSPGPDATGAGAAESVKCTTSPRPPRKAPLAASASNPDNTPWFKVQAQTSFRRLDPESLAGRYLSKRQCNPLG